MLKERTKEKKKKGSESAKQKNNKTTFSHLLSASLPMRGTPSPQVPSHVLNHNNEKISPTKHPLPLCCQNQQTNEVRPT